jgi:hypothetical protein
VVGFLLAWYIFWRSFAFLRAGIEIFEFGDYFARFGNQFEREIAGWK